LALAAFTDLLYTVQVLRDHLRDPNRDTSNDAFELAQFQRALYKYMDDYRGQLSSRVAEMLRNFAKQAERYDEEQLPDPVNLWNNTKLIQQQLMKDEETTKGQLR
jgi:hypothetical protein